MKGRRGEGDRRKEKGESPTTQLPNYPTTQLPNAHAVHLVAVGDILLAGPMGLFMEQKGRDYPFAALKPIIEQADIAFGNLECCIATSGQRVEKQFNFRANPGITPVLTETGFDIVSLANNHAWDFGRDALLETVQHVRQTGVKTVGAGANRAEAHRLCILRCKGLRVGFLAYLGLIPALVSESDTEPSLAMADVETIRKEVRAARKQVDVLIVSLHAGKEGAPQPTPRQKSFARAAIDAGADLVIGHHPHVVEPMVLYKGKLICYSLGNFVFSPAGRGSGALLDAMLYSNGRVKATLRPLSLAGGQPHFPRAASAERAIRTQAVQGKEE